MKMNRKMLLCAAGCAMFLCGCTKSNIVQPDETQGPDFNMYLNIELDMDQLHDDVDDICLDPSDYPMGAKIDFDINLDEEYVDVVVVVKDGTEPEEAAMYASDVLKGINDQVVVQDFSYGESGEDTFGGLYQDNVINLKIYEESEYEADGTPMYETQIPKDTYMEFEIAS